MAQRIRRNKKLNAKIHRANLRLEPLEDRRMLAAFDAFDVDESAAPGTELPITTWAVPRPVDLSLFVQPANRQPTQTFLSTNSDPDGDLPQEVVFSVDGSSVLVVNRDTDNLVIFDASSRTTTAAIPVGDFPVDVAVSPDGNYAVVPNVISNTVSIVDLNTNTVAAHVPITGTQPYSVEITSDSAFAVVGVINDATDATFSVISLSTHTEVRSFPSGTQGTIGFFFNPESGLSGNVYTQFAVSSDNSTIVFPDQAGDQISLYDLNTGLETATLASAGAPGMVDISADGTTAVVAHRFSANRMITEVDLVGRTITGAFPTTAELRGHAIRITPDKNFAIAAISNNVIFVDLTSGATTSTVSTGVVGDIELSFDGQYAFVSNFNSSVIDIASQTKVKSLTLSPSSPAATSPVDYRAVALNNSFAEEVNFFNIDGSSGFVEGFALSGPIAEGDATRTLGISGDGRTVVGGNNLSRNVSIIDLETRSVRAYVDTGERVLGVDVSPDGNTAVVANAETNRLSIIDLTTDTLAKNVPVFSRPADVLISPDSQMAYVTTVAGTDRLHFVELNGSSSSVVGSLITGQMGSANGYAFTKTSGIAQTNDGSILGLAISFDDELLLVDTATRTEIARVSLPNGSFPIDLEFSADGSKAYVLNAFGDSVSVVDVNGAASSLVTTINGIHMPITVDVDPAGEFVYVGRSELDNSGLTVIRTATNTVVRTLPLGGTRPRTSHLSSDGILYLGSNGNHGDYRLYRIDANGPLTSVLDSTQLTGAVSELVHSESLQMTAIAVPAHDGVDLVTDRACDFNEDSFCDTADIDALVGEIASGSNNSLFDLNGDGMTDALDRDEWLSLAGEINLGPGRAYLLGDANLDSFVNGLDFLAWNDNKFTAIAEWSAGDFNANGVVDGADFLVWNDNKFQSADSRNYIDAMSLHDKSNEEDDEDGERVRKLDGVFSTDFTISLDRGTRRLA